MPQLANKKLILLLVSVIFLVALISFSLRDRQNASLPAKIVKDTVGFAQSMVAKPTDYITGFFVEIQSLLNTYEENKHLKVRLEDFASLETKVSDLERENAALQELVDSEASLRDFEPIQATVIARNPDQWEEKIVLNRGSSHGVEKNMAVMTAKGLIGKITVVTSFTSEVELINTTNANYRVSAYVQSGKADVYGLIEGFDQERGELVVKRLDNTSKIKKGERVMTSGLGGIFPKGILIGEVTEVVADEFGLTKSAYVKPSANFSLLENVIIVGRTALKIDGLDGDSTNVDLTNGPDQPADEGE